MSVVLRRGGTVDCIFFFFQVCYCSCILDLSRLPSVVLRSVVVQFAVYRSVMNRMSFYSLPSAVLGALFGACLRLDRPRDRQEGVRQTRMYLFMYVCMWTAHITVSRERGRTGCVQWGGGWKCPKCWKADYPRWVRLVPLSMYKRLIGWNGK